VPPAGVQGHGKRSSGAHSNNNQQPYQEQPLYKPKGAT